MRLFLYWMNGCLHEDILVMNAQWFLVNDYYNMNKGEKLRHDSEDPTYEYISDVWTTTILAHLF